MRRGWWLAVLWVFVACRGGGGTGERQKAALEAQKKAIQGEVDQVLQGWLDQMARTLPEDVRKFEKSRSPLVRWRLDSFQYDWKRPLEAAVVKVRGTVLEDAFRAPLEFFQAMDAFWKKEIDFKDYLAAYRKVKEASDDPLVLLLADFDHAFLHLEAFYGAQDMEGDDRAIYFFRHWQVAFSFPREKGEAVSEYLARLCMERPLDVCREVPFESLHFALERPYLLEVKRIVGEYLKAHPDQPINRVFQTLLQDIEARLPRIPAFPEDPVMPTVVSKAPFVGDVVVTVRPSGLTWEEREYLSFQKGWLIPAKEWGVFQKAVKDRMPGFEKDRGPENLEILLLAMDQQAAMGVAARVVDAMKAEPPRYVTFGGRRRIDGMNRRTTFGKLQFREVPVAPRKAEVEGQGSWKCLPLGQTPDSDDLPGQVGPTVLVTTSGIRTGTFQQGKVGGLADGDLPGALAHLRSGTGLLLIGEDVPLQAVAPLIQSLFEECGDERCTFLQKHEPRLEVQVCGR
ncbi:MAG TPA: hypothetical protein PLQ97_05155 [Myxococcota bacterium]|nr:hypothetical protein [Myxococcota bacterium]HQK51634.1 hypothetical protein [Myxococcota bacterium]